MGIWNHLKSWLHRAPAEAGITGTPPPQALPSTNSDPAEVDLAQINLATIREHFNLASQDEENFPATIDPRILHIREIARHMAGGETLAGKRLADIGSGKGRFARVLLESEPACHIVTLDLAEAMLRHVPGQAHPVAASMTHLPLADHSFDGAWAAESLEHAVDIDTAVAELCRIVKPGGRIAIIDKNKDAWGRLETPSWERWFGQRELEAMLTRHCREVTSQPISYWEDVEPDGMFLIWLAVK